MTRVLSPAAEDFLGRLQRTAGTGALKRGMGPEKATKEAEAIVEAFALAMTKPDPRYRGLGLFITGVRNSHRVCEPFEPCLMKSVESDSEDRQEAMFT